MKLIGSGAFSKVYHEAESQYVYINSTDPVKECMAFGWFPKSKVFPKIQFSDDPKYRYKMRYYPRVRSLKSSLDTAEWGKYQALRCMHNDTRSLSLEDAFKTLPYRGLRNALIDAIDALANYGEDVCFEVSPRNVAAWGGKLILLDTFFMQSALNNVRK